MTKGDEVATVDGYGTVQRKLKTGYLVWIVISKRFRALRFFTNKEVKKL